MTNERKLFSRTDNWHKSQLVELKIFFFIEGQNVAFLVIFYPAGMLRHRLLYRNGTFVPPHPVNTSSSAGENGFFAKNGS